MNNLHAAPQALLPAANDATLEEPPPAVRPRQGMPPFDQGGPPLSFF